MKLELPSPLQQLLAIYTEFPCRTLPNAFWKTAIRLDESDLEIRTTHAGALASLVIRHTEGLLAFWCADPNDHPLSHAEIEQVPFALVHAKALPVFAQRTFTERRPYFRLVHKSATVEGRCPSGFGFAPVNIQKELKDVVGLLRTCYPGFKINAEVVQAWLEHPVYDPQLWLWVVDAVTGEKVGLGIAEYDHQVPEVSLEWLQVLQAYRSQGLAAALVSELIRRASCQVKIITVSGDAESTYQPEKLYRKCGFTGDDIWWVLSERV